MQGPPATVLVTCVFKDRGTTEPCPRGLWPWEAEPPGTCPGSCQLPSCSCALIAPSARLEATAATQSPRLEDTAATRRPRQRHKQAQRSLVSSNGMPSGDSGSCSHPLEMLTAVWHTGLPGLLWAGLHACALQGRSEQALSSRPTPVLSPESKNLRERCSRPAQTQAASSRHRVTTTFGESDRHPSKARRQASALGLSCSCHRRSRPCERGARRVPARLLLKTARAAVCPSRAMLIKVIIKMNSSLNTIQGN
ncbi:uncharacterized protein LOC123001300 isoform X3 [Ursus arctos]|uniref:uncharacterized protein LOC123001300 isoform X3 n=1 Tax=Ursus arctos TaxID=9644 RepID=UPI0025492747|nr:uncharacterized protein LOC123001300 isoform X3 [Ursus arctos]